MELFFSLPLPVVCATTSGVCPDHFLGSLLLFWQSVSLYVQTGQGDRRVVIVQKGGVFDVTTSCLMGHSLPVFCLFISLPFSPVTAETGTPYGVQNWDCEKAGREATNKKRSVAASGEGKDKEYFLI